MYAERKGGEAESGVEREEQAGNELNLGKSHRAIEYGHVLIVCSQLIETIAFYRKLILSHSFSAPYTVIATGSFGPFRCCLVKSYVSFDPAKFGKSNVMSFHVDAPQLSADM